MWPPSSSTDPPDSAASEPHAASASERTPRAARGVAESRSKELPAEVQEEDPLGVPDVEAYLRNLRGSRPDHSPTASTLLPLADATLDEFQYVLQHCRPAHLEADVATAMAAVVERRRVERSTVAALIGFLGRTNAWRYGVAAFKSLHGLGAMRCRACAHAALRACVHGRDARAAWEVYGLMDDPCMRPNSDTFKLLIPLLADRGDWTCCLQCFVQAVRGYCYLSAAACISVLARLKGEGRWREAEAVLVCALPVSPFQTLAEALYWPPEHSAAPSLLATLQQTSLRYVEPLVALPLPAATHGFSAESGVMHVDIGQAVPLRLAGRPAAQKRPDAASPAPPRRASPTSSSDESSEDMPRVTERVPLYLLGSDAAVAGCNLLLELYSQATPPLAARCRELLSAMVNSHAAALMPAPDAASYMLTITAHRGVGSAAEAQDLLRFLGRTNWQPPDDALMQLLEIACGGAAGGGDAGDADGGSVGAGRPRHRAQPVPPPWRDFLLRGTLPQGVTCLRFLADAAASAGTGVRAVEQLRRSPGRARLPSPDAHAPAQIMEGGPVDLETAPDPEPVELGASDIGDGGTSCAASIAWEATTMLAALARCTAADDCDPDRVLVQMLQSGVAVSWTSVALCCDHVAQQQQAGMSAPDVHALLSAAAAGGGARHE